ncbi:MAG: T9SS type A sorting domain-containing protein [Candidatus Cloacimonetes bacterium]|nr:T9SS type A sorting domain-containing protein [Candidatus Cloacimonadota bacterium]
MRKNAIILMLLILSTQLLMSVGGDNITTAVSILSIPYYDTGSTVNLTNTMMNLSNDTFYKITPVIDITGVSIDLSGSVFDTQLWILNDEGVLLWSDSDTGSWLTSALYGLTLEGGITYYICIEGNLSSNGDYIMNIDADEPWPNLSTPRLIRNISPFNGATRVSTGVTLTWDFGLITDSYDLLIGTTNPPTTQVVTGASAGVSGSYTPSVPFQNLTTYYWTVVCHNNLTTVPNYNYMSFTTDDAGGLHITNVTPENGEENVPTNISLSWDFANTTQTYDLYFDVVFPPVNPVVIGAPASGQGEYLSPGLSSNTTYFWKIISRNTSIENPTVDYFRFTTLSYGPAIEIGDSLEVDAHVPIEPNANYSYSQSLYYQEDINTINCQINYLCYQLNQVSTLVNNNNWTIYMGHTDKDGFTSVNDWIPITEMIEVYHGEHPVVNADGWLEFSLDTPFIYNNEDNLVIAVSENQPGASNDSEDFYCSSVFWQDRCIYSTAYTNPIDPVNPPAADRRGNWYPNVKFYRGEMSEDAELRYYPQTYDFGSLYTHYVSDSLKISFQNIGLEPMVISSIVIDDNENFTLTDLNNYPLFLVSTQNSEIWVKFNPMHDGSFTGTVTISDTNGNTNTIVLTGESADVTISDFPYPQTFNLSTIPLGWRIEPETEGWQLANNEFGGHGATQEATGNGGFYIGIDDGLSEAYPNHLYSPPIDLINAPNPALSFKYWIGDDLNFSSLFIDVLNIDLIATNIAQYQQLFGSTFWTSAVIPLTEYSGQIVTIDFRGVHGQGYKGDICLDDVFIYSDYDAVDENIIEPNEITSLQSNYPNPFNPETTIAFSLKEKGNVKIDIYNITGQHIYTVTNETYDPGHHTIIWNGDGKNGNKVPTGIYFYKMESGTYTKTRKMILLK